MVTAEGDEVALDGIASGQMLLQGEVPGHYTPAILQASKVHFDISGMIATVAVEQSFRNGTGRALEGYTPSTAGHRRRVIHGDGHRRAAHCRQNPGEDRGEKLYSQAKAAGKRPAWWSSSAPIYLPTGWPI